MGTLNNKLEMHGHGTYTYKNRDQYVGDFQGGKKHGRGTMKHKNGNTYVGEFSDNDFLVGKAKSLDTKPNVHMLNTLTTGLSNQHS